ncbi:uncharacterized protein LOC108736862 [Agrilus planipennis]|uniref:Uncharacterized protein LOC108736862 n=1 Tax=Agrilus planipennis TaxID=224129 RepID=A0A1W4WY12_AGRPL|nr:uncharacterized protein LOC108736862 [Agrilus planipennis]
MVLYTASHSSVRSIDHLSEVLKELGKGSQLEKLRLHPSKAAKLIVNVVAPVMLEELIIDIGEQDYSIILDESTDVSTIKYMAYCVRYISRSLDQFVTDFLGFAEVFTATAENYCNVQLMKCSCHSLSLCGSKASDELPASVEFLLKESGIGFQEAHYDKLFTKICMKS